MHAKNLISQKDFLEKYNIDPEKFKATLLKWIDLGEIYLDYCKILPELQSAAGNIFNMLTKMEDIHSVRYRIKDPEHVIEKIIRKTIENPKRVISLSTYKKELDDLVGLRALHLFKEQWQPIHEFIYANWNIKGKAVLNYREGDRQEYLKRFKDAGLMIEKHRSGYRSIHYVIKTRPAKRDYLAEIQVRTIFEEAWSEIDHTIRYPYDTENQFLSEFLLIFNRLAGTADEMGTFIKYLKTTLSQKEEEYQKAILGRDKIIRDLEAKIEELKKDKKIDKSDSEILTK